MKENDPMTTKRLAWGGSAALLCALLLAGGYAASEARDGGLDPDAARALAPLEADGGMLVAENPCNPCGKKNACNPCNPCGKKNPCNPCGAANPCNPCGGAAVDPKRVQQGSHKLSGKVDQAFGRKLWNDRTLGKSGLACSNCHIDQYAQMQPSFAKPYPHRVAMPHQQAGIDKVNAAGMVQFCMVVPMAADPLPWDSKELASLSAYVESLQTGYQPVAGGGANPCNPCGAKNPCNPCGAKNPCNPCGR
jgi:hypothetical protein